MQSVSSAVTREPVITSNNVVRLTAVVSCSLCFVTLAGVTVYAIKKTGGTEVLSGMAQVVSAISGLQASLG